MPPYPNPASRASRLLTGRPGTPDERRVIPLRGVG